MDIIPDVAAVQGNQCYGCLRYNSDIMITFMQGMIINDFFLKESQAIELVEKILLQITYNRQRQ